MSKQDPIPTAVYHAHVFTADETAAEAMADLKMIVTQQFAKQNGKVVLTDDETRLTLTLDDGWLVRLVLRDGKQDSEVAALLTYILAEKRDALPKSQQSLAQAAGPEHGRYAFELWTEPDPSMTHFNDYVSLIQILEYGFPDAITYDHAYD